MPKSPDFFVTTASKPVMRPTLGEHINRLTVSIGQETGDVKYPIQAIESVHITYFNNYDKVAFEKKDKKGGEPDFFPLTEGLAADLRRAAIQYRWDHRRNFMNYMRENREGIKKSGLAIPEYEDVEPFTPGYQEASKRNYVRSKVFASLVEGYINHAPPTVTRLGESELLQNIKTFFGNGN